MKWGLAVKVITTTFEQENFSGQRSAVTDDTCWSGPTEIEVLTLRRQALSLELTRPQRRLLLRDLVGERKIPLYTRAEDKMALRLQGVDLGRAYITNSCTMMRKNYRKFLVLTDLGVTTRLVLMEKEAERISK